MEVHMRLEIAGDVTSKGSSGMREIGLLWHTSEADWDALPQKHEYMGLGVTSVPARYYSAYDGMHNDWRALVCEHTLRPDHGFLKLGPVRCLNDDVAEKLCAALVAGGWVRHI